MKKLFCIVSILLVITMLPVVVFAQTQEEWNLSCNYKTSCSTTVTRIVGDSEEYETIPANTYVRITDSVGDDKKVIKYMINGVTRSGMVSSSCLVRCSSQYRQPDGYAENVHELDPNHDEIVANNPVILIAPSLLEQGDADYSGVSYEKSEDSSAHHETQGADTKKGSGTQQPNEKAEMTTTQADVQVVLEQLGTQKSLITYQGVTSEVATAELNFGVDISEDKRIASVCAPRTGKASLRAKASTSADVIKKCKAGTIVVVLEYGKKFCKIQYDGSVGYILTSCLRFHASDETPISTGVLSYKGKATGSTTINIRASADGDSAKIAEWRTGTEVLVFTKENNWYEIEANGMRGYVKAEFLTLVDE